MSSGLCRGEKMIVTLDVGLAVAIVVVA